VVLGGEVRGQQADGCQVHGAVLEPLQDDGEPSGGSSGLDAPVRGVLGEMEHLRTIREQRGAALGKVQATFVQLRQVGDESTRRLAFACREVFHPRHKRLVGEVNHRGERGGIHGPCIPSGFRTPQECPGCEATAPALHSHSGLRALRLDGLGPRQRHPRMTPRGLVDRGRRHVKSLVLAMKTFSSTQLGPDRVARNALIRGCGTAVGP